MPGIEVVTILEDFSMEGKEDLPKSPIVEPDGKDEFAIIFQGVAAKKVDELARKWKKSRKDTIEIGLALLTAATEIKENRGNLMKMAWDGTLTRIEIS